MRKKTNWLDITVQFAAFAVMCLVLSLARFPLLVNIVLAFGLSMAISTGYSIYKRRQSAHRTEPKRVRVYSVKNVDDH